MQKLLTRKEYSEVISKFSKNYCAFCDKNFKQIEVRQTKEWNLVFNIAPYWLYHLIIYPKRHIEKMSEISAEDFEQIKFLYDQALGLYKDNKIKHKNTGKLIDQYVLIFRYRESTENNFKSYKVRHLHIHISPDCEDSFDPILDKDASETNLENFIFS